MAWWPFDDCYIIKYSLLKKDSLELKVKSRRIHLDANLATLASYRLVINELSCD